MHGRKNIKKVPKRVYTNILLDVSGTSYCLVITYKQPSAAFSYTQYQLREN